jgi:hypothetical protein
MLRAALLDAWPPALALLPVCGTLAMLVRLVRMGERRPILALHGDERGSVQSLSFVLTVPVFIMLMLLAVQITQLMIGLVVVHYAAYAAARSATVWIPARLEPDELENRIGHRTLQGNENAGEIYQISPGSTKFERIRQAAALACVPIAPSRDLGLANPGDPMAQSLVSVFQAISPTATTNPRIPRRLANKWAYADLATHIEIRTFHRRYGDSGIALWDEPPLWDLESSSPEGHFKANEIGWRDQIRVTVIHQFALLPGPGRLLARRANESRYADTVSPKIQRAGNVYFVPLLATATMVGEGEKSVRPYVY